MTALRELLQAARTGDRPALARLLSIAERGGHEVIELDALLPVMPEATLLIGVTGPPGAGKSTLINALLPRAVSDLGRAAVLAVDPSSPFSNGAILGDRVRMHGGGHGGNVFIRSMASRGELGGLASATALCARVLGACGWPLVLIETLGIGQVELEIVHQADCVAVVLNPGWGDTIQANKAGITEAGDLFVINKSDRPGADRTRRDLVESLQLLQRDVPPAVFDTVATEDTGVAALWQHLLEEHARMAANGTLDARREARRARAAQDLLRQQLLRLCEETLNHPVGTVQAGAATVGLDAQLRSMLEGMLARLGADAASRR